MKKAAEFFFLSFKCFLCQIHIKAKYKGKKYMGPYLVISLMTNVMNCCCC